MATTVTLGCVEPDVVGREAELDVIARWVEGPHPSALLIEGEAGIGKTTLWREGVDRAGDLGWRVLMCSAAGAETQLSFTALRDLLDEAFDEFAEELSEPQRRALADTLLREDPADRPPEPSMIALAFLTGLSTLAAHGPMLLAIDDVQWLDSASAGPVSQGSAILQRPGKHRLTNFGKLLAL